MSPPRTPEEQVDSDVLSYEEIETQSLEALEEQELRRMAVEEAEDLDADFDTEFRPSVFRELNFNFDLPREYNREDFGEDEDRTL